jgi:hypothetical protein
MRKSLLLGPNPASLHINEKGATDQAHPSNAIYLVRPAGFFRQAQNKFESSKGGFRWRST